MYDVWYMLLHLDAFGLFFGGKYTITWKLWGVVFTVFHLMSDNQHQSHHLSP